MGDSTHEFRLPCPTQIRTDNIDNLGDRSQFPDSLYCALLPYHKSRFRKLRNIKGIFSWKRGIKNNRCSTSRGNTKVQSYKSGAIGQEQYHTIAGLDTKRI